MSQRGCCVSFTSNKREESVTKRRIPNLMGRSFHKWFKMWSIHTNQLQIIDWFKAISNLLVFWNLMYNLYLSFGSCPFLLASSYPFKLISSVKILKTINWVGRTTFKTLKNLSKIVCLLVRCNLWNVHGQAIIENIKLFIELASVTMGCFSANAGPTKLARFLSHIYTLI